MDKKTVLEYFHKKPGHPSDAFNTGFGLYKQTPGKNNNIERSLNSGGYTPSNLETLEYELKRLHGITDLECIPPVVVNLVEPSLVEKLAIAIRETGNKDLLLAIKAGMTYSIDVYLVLADKDSFSEDLKNYLKKQGTAVRFLNELVENVLENAQEDFGEEELASLLESLKPDLDGVELPENIKAELNELATKYPAEDEYDEDPLDMLLNAKAALEELAKIEPEHLKNKASEDKDQTIENLKSIRDQYPFLDAPDCPDELKILVADKISAYRRYKEAHAQLAKCNAGEITLTETEQLALAATATSNFANSEAIQKELDYYKEHGKILAEHPTLINIALKNEVESMDTTKLLNLIKDKSFFTRKNKAIAAAKTEEEKAGLQLEIEHRKLRIKLAKEKLGISD